MTIQDLQASRAESAEIVELVKRAREAIRYFDNELVLRNGILVDRASAKRDVQEAVERLIQALKLLDR